MSNTPIYSLGLWAGPQSQPWVQHDAALRLIEALVRGSVADRDLTAPPGSCADGAAYLVAAAATGLWATHDGQLAVAVGVDASNGWIFAAIANEGAVLWIADEDLRLQYNGAAWVTFTAAAAGQKEVAVLQVSDPNGAAITIGDGKAYFTVPQKIDGWNLTATAAALVVGSSSGAPLIQIRNVTDAVDMLSTRISIDVSELHSKDAATPPVIDTAHDDVAYGDLLAVDIDTAGTDAKGLMIVLTFEAP